MQKDLNPLGLFIYNANIAEMHDLDEDNKCDPFALVALLCSPMLLYIAAHLSLNTSLQLENGQPKPHVSFTRVRTGFAHAALAQTSRT